MYLRTALPLACELAVSVCMCGVCACAGVCMCRVVAHASCRNELVLARAAQLTVVWTAPADIGFCAHPSGTRSDRPIRINYTPCGLATPPVCFKHRVFSYIGSIRSTVGRRELLLQARLRWSTVRRRLFLTRSAASLSSGKSVKATVRTVLPQCSDGVDAYG